jgi:hypothetical protein
MRSGNVTGPLHVKCSAVVWQPLTFLCYKTRKYFLGTLPLWHSISFRKKSFMNLAEVAFFHASFGCEASSTIPFEML